MKLDRTLEWDEQQQLVIGTTLHVVLLGALALVQSTRLGGLKQHLDRSSVLVSVEELAPPRLDRVRDVTVALGNSSPHPETAAGTALPERLDLRGEFLHHVLQLDRVGALHLLDHLAIAEDEEGRQPGDAVLPRELSLVVVVDLNECDEVRPREGSGECFVEGRDLLARAAPVGVDCEERRTFVSFRLAVERHNFYAFWRERGMEWRGR